MTTNHPFANEEPLEPSGKNEHPINFDNADHDLLVQLFSAWLHPDLCNLPGIDWKKMPDTVSGYLVNKVGDSPYAPHIALATGATLGYFAPLTLRYYSSCLNILLNTIRTRSDSWNGTNLTREVWEEYATKETNISKRLNCLRGYARLTGHHFASYVARLDSEQRRRVSPYILPPLPARFLELCGSNAALIAEE